LPFYNTSPAKEHVSQSTQQKKEFVYVDLDGELLNKTHRENLEDLELDLPSEVQRKGTYEETLNIIKTENRKIGQHLGILSKKDEKEKAVYESQKQTLKIYTKKIKNLEGSTKEFIISEKTGEGLRKRKIVKQKRGRGRPRKYPDTVYYSNPYEICVKLNENIDAKRAGNTGLDNIINSILDELLNIKYIDKNVYDNLYKNIF